MKEGSLDDLLIDKSSVKLKYAGFAIRGLAIVIDNVALIILWVIITKLIPRGENSDILAGILFLVLFSLMIVIEAIKHASPGKMILGLEVLAEEREELSVLQTVKRNIIKYILIPVIVLIIITKNEFIGYIGYGCCFFTFVDFVSILSDKKNRTYHDQLSDTVVVYKN